jgi:hypothetical protein
MRERGEEEGEYKKSEMEKIRELEAKKEEEEERQVLYL